MLCNLNQLTSVKCEKLRWFTIQTKGSSACFPLTSIERMEHNFPLSLSLFTMNYHHHSHCVSIIYNLPTIIPIFIHDLQMGKVFTIYPFPSSGTILRGFGHSCRPSTGHSSPSPSAAPVRHGRELVMGYKIQEIDVLKTEISLETWLRDENPFRNQSFPITWKTLCQSSKINSPLEYYIDIWWFPEIGIPL